MAPELGLFLDECYYSAYNKQWGDLHCALQQADFQQQVDEFKVSGCPGCPGCCSPEAACLTQAAADGDDGAPEAACPCGVGFVVLFYKGDVSQAACVGGLGDNSRGPWRTGRGWPECQAGVTLLLCCLHP
jgi:hypothetical protein